MERARPLLKRWDAEVQMIGKDHAAKLHCNPEGEGLEFFKIIIIIKSGFI